MKLSVGFVKQLYIFKLTIYLTSNWITEDVSSATLSLNKVAKYVIKNYECLENTIYKLFYFGVLKIEIHLINYSKK